MNMYMPIKPNPVNAVSSTSKNVTLNSNVHSHNQPKIIIFWTKYYGHLWMGNQLKQCTCAGKHKCYSTSNHSLLPYADAVVFHGFENEFS